MKPLFLLGLCALLCGAVLPAPVLAAASSEDEAKITEQARVKIQSDVADCHAREDAGAFKTNREAAQCVNSAIQRVMLSIRYPYTDLLQLVSAFRVGCAGKVDSREMTKDDCKKLMDKLRQRVSEEEQSRRSAAAAPKTDKGTRPVARAKRSGMSKLVNGIAKWTDPDEPAAASPQHLTCMQVGTTVSCY